jgi:cytochrome oxidase Cu insertion factor (SCO1/SenC/PrrC family)
MLYLAVAVVLVGVLTLLNLVLVFGVIRRLREHTALLSTRAEMPELMRPAGEHADEFAATTVDGDPVSRDLLAGRTLVAYLSTNCAPCRKRLPEFVSVAEGFPGGRSQVLAVVSSSGPDDPAAAEYAERLAGVARVVVEPGLGPVSTAFGVSGFPAFAVVEEQGRIAASNVDLAELAVPSAA